MARIDSFLQLVAEQKASDLHFHAGSPPLIRHDGDLMALPFRTLSGSEVYRFLREIVSDEQLLTLADDWEIDFVHDVPGVGRFRVNAFRILEGLGAVFRVIPAQVPRFEELALPAAARKLVQYNNGLVLLSGPTGSGKTTTMACLIDELNRSQERHVLTIEDPIEFLHESKRALITQRQVGDHAPSFASALRSAMREAPDVIVVGELRDLETIQLALSAAEMGVLVIGTLHTSSASKAIDRVIDMVPEDSREQVRSVLAVLLRGVLAQNLCKRAGGEGRIPLVELMLQTYGVAAIIRENKLHLLDGFLSSASNDGTGMQSMDSCILRYVRDGEINLDEGLRYATYPEVVRSQAESLGKFEE